MFAVYSVDIEAESEREVIRRFRKGRIPLSDTDITSVHIMEVGEIRNEKVNNLS